MAKDNQVLVRVNDPTDRAISNFAEDRDYNKAEAVRRITESRLRSEGYLTREIYGNDETEVRTDGSGYVIRPLLRTLGAIYSGAILAIFTVLLVGLAGVQFSFIPYGELLPLMLSISIFVAVLMLLLYTQLPERADLVIRDKVNFVRRKWVQVKA